MQSSACRRKPLLSSLSLFLLGVFVHLITRQNDKIDSNLKLVRVVGGTVRPGLGKSIKPNRRQLLLTKATKRTFN